MHAILFMHIARYEGEWDSPDELLARNKPFVQHELREEFDLVYDRLEWGDDRLAKLGLKGDGKEYMMNSDYCYRLWLIQKKGFREVQYDTVDKGGPFD